MILLIIKYKGDGRKAYLLFYTIQLQTFVSSNVSLHEAR